MNNTNDIDVFKAREMLVFKSNHIVRKEFCNLDATSYKLIAYIISKIKKNSNLNIYHFTCAEFIAVAGFNDSGSNYNRIINSIYKLHNPKLVFDNNGDIRSIQWLSDVYISPANKIIVVELSKKVIPFLLNLTNNFTAYNLIYILGMKSSYSMHLYEFCKSYASKNEININIDELRLALGIIPGKVKRFSDLNRILRRAIKEINSNTDIVIHTYINYGKSNKAINVIIYIKEKEIFERLNVIKDINNKLDKKR